MSSSIPKFADAETAAQLAGALSDQYAIVANPPYIYPPYDVYPLSKGTPALEDGLLAAVMDMDGTTTTTEPCCIDALNMMVRRCCGRADDPAWPGLDQQRDYPHIIGNSTTKHVEYLVRAYGDRFLPEALRVHLVLGAAWTLARGKDPGRKRDLRNTLAALGVAGLENDPAFLELMTTDDFYSAASITAAQTVAEAHRDAFNCDGVSNLTRAGIEIYYQRYHEVLGWVAEGRGDAMAEQVLGPGGKRLIGPMPGVGVFLALLKGWLGDEAALFADTLAEPLRAAGMLGENELPACRGRLERLGAYLAKHPARVALVTSSIHYEADLVLTEVFRIVRAEIGQWPVSDEKRAFLLEHFSSPHAYYDGFITATDSSEIRLKPHRDLYSMAMHEIGLYPEDFGKAVGFEDSESGTIAIRAAGIRVCCALPFHMTTGHHFAAATRVCPGGLPEVMLKHGLFLRESLLDI
jgi:beta-phosphoglucomutase-like phosphatase (HAD superfamily)